MDSNKITICFLQRNINESGTQSNRNKAKWNILNELSQNMYLKSQIKHEQKKYVIWNVLDYWVDQIKQRKILIHSIGAALIGRVTLKWEEDMLFIHWQPIWMT